MKLPIEIASYDISQGDYFNLDEGHRIVMSQNKITFTMKWGSIEGPFDVDRVPDWIMNFFVQDEDAVYEIIEPKRLTL